MLKMISFIVLFSLFNLFSAAPQQTAFDELPAPYDFQYKIANLPTNTFFGQNENGDVAGRVTGSYYVQLPDGRLMTVEYVSDQNGYRPKVSFQQNGNPGLQR